MMDAWQRWLDGEAEEWRLLLREEFTEMTEKLKTYEVTVSPPGSERLVYRVQAKDVLGAKTEASKLYYNHVFTGQYKYMRAKLVKEASK